MTMKKPLISIITVCKNSQTTIARTIESVLNQTYKSYEYIIIDGVSTDKTLDIIKSYEKKFKGRMKWISEKDGGIYDAMNKGIIRAKGEIIGILNSDDWYEKDAIQNVVNSYLHHGEGIYYGILRYYYNNEVLMLKSVSHKFLSEEMIQHPTCFVTKSIYDKLGIFSLDYKYGSDYELMLRFYNNGANFFMLDKILANFRCSGLTSTNELKTNIEFLKIRSRYGYLTKRGVILRIVKNYLLSYLRRIK